jgi:uncharacterized protein
MKWLQRSADQGRPEAQDATGEIYALGMGVPQDYGEALKWFRLAAEENQPSAQYSLAIMYAAGHSVPVDNKEAARLALLSAEQGMPKAQYFIGTAFGLGQGVPQSYIEALKWLILSEQGARRTGDKANIDLATKNMKYAKSQMKRGQIKEAEKLAREWALEHGSGSTD